MKEKTKYYSLEAIKKQNATYNVIIGERSNGKTFACLEEILRNYWKNHRQGAYIRRWDEDVRGRRGMQTFNGLVAAKKVEVITNGVWDDITYINRAWYLSRYDEELDKKIVDDTPFCFSFALTMMEHDKSSNYDGVSIVLFDEFLAKDYLENEFVIFMNVLSTIIRQREDVTIYMCANTINKYAPYFGEMGLTNVASMKQGSIDVYTYGDSKLRVAVEYCGSIEKSKVNNYMFGFNNPKLHMITNGAWEIDIYPHLLIKYKPKDVIENFFIQWERYTLHGEVIYIDNSIFLYIHNKTTPIKEDESTLVFSNEYDYRPNHIRDITKPQNLKHQKIMELFRNGRVFYQSNEIGELVRNYFSEFGVKMAI